MEHIPLNMREELVEVDCDNGGGGAGGGGTNSREGTTTDHHRHSPTGKRRNKIEIPVVSNNNDDERMMGVVLVRRDSPPPPISSSSPLINHTRPQEEEEKIATTGGSATITAAIETSPTKTILTTGGRRRGRTGESPPPLRCVRFNFVGIDDDDDDDDQHPQQQTMEGHQSMSSSSSSSSPPSSGQQQQQQQQHHNSNDPSSSSSLLQEQYDKLQHKFTNALIDLSSEKALRKRKEKNIFKLAKELQKRSTELDAKDKQIEKLLKMSLRMHGGGSATKSSQRREPPLTHEEDTGGKGEESKEKKIDELLVVQHQQQETISNLRRQLLQAHLDMDRLRTQLETNSGGKLINMGQLQQQQTCSWKKFPRVISLLLPLVVVVGLFLFVTVLLFPSSSVANVICAPSFSTPPPIGMEDNTAAATTYNYITVPWRSFRANVLSLVCENNSNYGAYENEALLGQ